MEYLDAIERMACAICRDNMGDPYMPMAVGGKWAGQPQWKLYESAARAAAQSIGLLGIYMALSLSKDRKSSDSILAMQDVFAKPNISEHRRTDTGYL